MKTITNTLAVIAALFIALPAQADEGIYVDYVRNYDGDTVTVDIVDLQHIDPDGTYSVLWDNMNIRVNGIDTPEIRTRCKSEKALGKVAKYFVADLLKNAQEVKLVNLSRGKYFRLVADVIADGVNIADALIDADLAVPYDGRKKKRTTGVNKTGWHIVKCAS